MNKNIVCHIISGFLGSGKSSFIKQLLSYRPAHEKWAVLVNEIGNVNYHDVHGLNKHIFIKEVYGGCLCCSAGMPFRVALNKLIKEVSPDRIFIEPAGAGHLQNIKTLLQEPFYQTVLNLQQSICLLTETHLTDSKYANNDGYLLLINQADGLCISDNDDKQYAEKMAKYYSKSLYIMQNNRQDLAFIEQDQSAIKRPSSSPASIKPASSSTKPSLLRFR